MILEDLSIYESCINGKMTKLVYKRNIGVDGKLEFYVAKIVAKGYSLKLCFNNGKPFQQWSYSNPSYYYYLLLCVSFVRYKNQTFS